MSRRLATLLILCVVANLFGSYQVSTLGIVLFCCILIISTNDTNIRFLVASSSLSYFIFYELNVALYFLTADVLKTGNVVGDLFLNIVGLIGIATGILIVIHRERLMYWFYKVMDLPQAEYFCLEADFVQSRALKIMFIFNLIATLILVLVSIWYFNIDIDTDPTSKEYVRVLFKNISQTHVQIWQVLDIILYVVLAYLIHEDCLIKKGKNVNTFTF